jgi:sphingolipid 4-desaturase/C4-monooxygenase
LEHHRYQGDEVIDTDLPTLFEAKLFSTTFGKFCWVLLQPLFYVFRPLTMNPKVPGKLEIINVIIQVICDALIIHFFGWRMLVYLIGALLIAMGLHPVAGHFISEHYMFDEGFETYSYYGPFNSIVWNAGLHREHHDFPCNYILFSTKNFNNKLFLNMFSDSRISTSSCTKNCT